MKSLFRLVSQPLNSNSTADQIHWPQLHLIALVGLILRLLIAFTSDQINHPDEIFQYLEQAHRLVFGYGYIPWDYRFGIRSWILPGLLSVPLQVVKVLHLDEPEIYISIIKILTCLVSVSLIYCVYEVGRRLASEEVGRWASVIACFWHELIVFAHKPTPECLSTYLLMGALVCLLGRSTWLSAGLLGVMGAGILALRLQYAPVVLVLAIATLLLWKRDRALVAAGSFLAVLLLVGYVDYLTWGRFFGSYYNNYLYNQVYGVSSIFGKVFPLYYLGTLILFSGGIFPVVIFSVAREKMRSQWLLLSLLVSIVIPHSLIPHKEYRFIYATVPICILLTTIAFVELKHRCHQPNSKRPRLPLYLATFMIFWSILGTLSSTAFFSKKDTLESYLFLSDQPNLVAIANLHSAWYESGGYYYLHRNVPIYSIEDFAPVSPADYSKYVSHIVCPEDREALPGFTKMAKFGSLEVRRNENPPPDYESLGVDTYRPLQGGVDGVLEPPKF
ncbi:MAG TPA: hypothetical protein V6D29_20840 [Leptolyngbyaceae cyanobacterium]